MITTSTNHPFDCHYPEVTPKPPEKKADITMPYWSSEAEGRQLKRKEVSVDVNPTEVTFEERHQGDFKAEGVSSYAMAQHMVSNGSAPSKDFKYEYPSDGEDFGRCVRLLERYPAWQSRVHEMAAYGQIWTKLTKEWDELTHLYHTEKSTCDKRVRQITGFGLAREPQLPRTQIVINIRLVQ